MIPMVLLPKDKTPGDMDADTLKDGGTVYHIIGENGIFLRHHNDLYSSVQKVEKLPHLGTVEEKCIVNFKPVPSKMLDEMTAFAKAVYDRHKAEAAAIMYYNPTTKEWRWDVPEQETTPGGLSVNYKAPPPPPEGFRILGSFHSHADAGAFQSGTDQHDETHFDGVHITVGRLDGTPDYHARLCVSGVQWTVKDDGLLIEQIVRPPANFDRSLLDRVKPKSCSSYSPSLYSPGDELWNYIDGCIPSSIKPPPESEHDNGLLRGSTRVCPKDASPSEYDRIGEGCWWKGQYFVKVGHRKGQWVELDKDFRQNIRLAWVDLQIPEREALSDAFTEDEFRFRMACMNPKHIGLRKLVKKARRIIAKEVAVDNAEDWGNDKRIHEMGNDEYAAWEGYVKQHGHGGD